MRSPNRQKKKTPQANLVTNSSETFEAFTTGPIPVVSYFENLVARLLHDNIDYASSGHFGSHNVEVVQAISPYRISYGDFHVPYRTLLHGYHAVYESMDTSNFIRRLGVLVANATIQHEHVPGIYNRNSAIRTYHTDSNMPGAIIRRDYIRPTGLHDERVLYGNISNPLDVNHYEDEDEAVFKHDMMTLKVSRPLKPLSPLQAIGVIAMLK